jgi:hypothetical protein
MAKSPVGKSRFVVGAASGTAFRLIVDFALSAVVSTGERKSDGKIETGQDETDALLKGIRQS